MHFHQVINCIHYKPPPAVNIPEPPSSFRLCSVPHLSQRLEAAGIKASCRDTGFLPRALGFINTSHMQWSAVTPIRRFIILYNSESVTIKVLFRWNQLSDGFWTIHTPWQWSPYEAEKWACLYSDNSPCTIHTSFYYTLFWSLLCASFRGCGLAWSLVGHMAAVLSRPPEATPFYTSQEIHEPLIHTQSRKGLAHLHTEDWSRLKRSHHVQLGLKNTEKTIWSALLVKEASV